jgi:hypothetical protein
MLRRNDPTRVPGSTTRRAAVWHETCTDSIIRTVRMAGSRRQDDGRVRTWRQYGSSETVQVQGLQSEPTLRASVVVRSDAQGKALPDAGRCLRADTGATQPVTSKQEAEKTWEPKFIGEIVAGRDPRKPPAPPGTSGPDCCHVSGLVLRPLRRRRVASECCVDSQPPGCVEGCSRNVAGLGAGTG